MKQISLIAVVITILSIVGCSSVNWEAQVDIPSRVKIGDSTPIKVSVKENGQPVSGLEIKTMLEMKRMDHGNEQVTLKEQEKGVYTGMVKLPMEGEWVANVEMNKEGKKKEISYEFKTEGVQ
ncbi:MAG TPA: FixH family protein [Bacillota bacterium]|nr:FixH family protein [Bacillota bacterium]